MLTHLSIRDFAIIEALDLDLHQGFHVITGETGAGKSIIIEAISLALGSRADTSFVRTGKEKAFIELTVTAEDPAVQALLAENALDPSPELLITREISAAGKNVCRINGSPVSVGFLNSLCRKLADIHGQYEHQSLLNPENHLTLLDAFGGDSFGPVKETVKDLYGRYASLSAKLAAWEKNRADSLRRQDFMRYELDEIRKAAPLSGEDTTLEEELVFLQNSERIYGNLSRAYETLNEQDASALSQLQQVSSYLAELEPFSSSLSALSDEIANCCYRLEDLAREIRYEKDTVTFSEERLNEIQERLEVLSLLKRKYGGSIDKTLEYAASLEEQLSVIEGGDEAADHWKAELAVCKDQLVLACGRLSELRKRSAKDLEAKINLELQELNFKDADFRVSFNDTPSAFTENGTDTAEFLLSANKGEALKPLTKVASGGELSRIMLAFKQIVGDYDRIPTMIFDEIDTGISGITASIVGRKLHDLSTRHQILCITHLPQIAAFGDHHYRIQKNDSGERTITTVVPLDREGRIDEIARLTGGLSITETTRKSAEELLNTCLQERHPS
ncbi:MAG: DNA repair protein RecN [Clostridiales bacterium]|nr:DNA repair protein RecN [Clostridiales bacterium]